MRDVGFDSDPVQLACPRSMGAREEAVLKRHKEIRAALRFFLDSWYKHKRVGAAPSPERVLHDLMRFRSLDAALETLKTTAPQVHQLRQQQHFRERDH